MNWLDIVIIIVVLGTLIVGFRQGLIKQAAALLAIVLAIYFSPDVASATCKYLGHIGISSGQYTPLISYAIAFTLIAAAVTLLGAILHSVISSSALSFLNHFIGGIFALLTIVLLISLIFNVLEITDAHSELLSLETKRSSQLYPYIKDLLPSIFPGSLQFFRN
jgi:uncharacterized membrane protein required for colicin V production